MSSGTRCHIVGSKNGGGIAFSSSLFMARLSRQSLRRQTLIERDTMLLRGQLMALETFGDTQVAKPLIVVGDHDAHFLSMVIH